MGRKRTPGLYKRKEIWHIDKQYNGSRLQESTGTHSLEEAERYLARRLECLRQAIVYGTRPARLFRQAATKYLLENQQKRSIYDDAIRLKILDSYIGDLQIEQVHMQTLYPFITARKKLGRKTKTINLALGLVRQILNLAATEWIDEQGLTWLSSAPKIKLLPLQDVRRPYPLSWKEQDLLFSYLPEHLRDMALFKVNTGTREQEVCQLQWEWEIPVDDLNTSVFIVPSHTVKNGEDRLIVLNEIAKSTIDLQRGKHSVYVFPYKGRPVTKINNSAWKNARKKANLVQVRVHDLKHTYGRRLRAAGVSFEDRQDLLGHKSGRITTHYSSAELENLISASNKVCIPHAQGTALILLRSNRRNLAYEQSAPAKVLHTA